MKKKYDNLWLLKMLMYGIGIAILLWVGISTVSVWFGRVYAWNIWELIVNK